MTRPRPPLAPDAATPLVEVKDLGRIFDVSKPWLNRVTERLPRRLLTAAAEVTFSIAKRETFALVGESGSGKSTVAKMVVGLIPPTTGEVIIDGVSMSDPQARRRAPPLAPPHPDGVPGPLRQPQSALARARHRGRAAARLRHRAERRRNRRGRSAICSSWSASIRRTARNIRTSSPAASASASRSRARSPAIRNSSCATSRPRRSTSRCRRRSST